ncbi:CdaR family transcriptional regulator [Peribacillus tepidiphilus]|uniref:CdaR family transcriptional regulator n=1 Tax=Peribacillus tepidiphilus TaxID=2652445 RepID=UPI0035B55E82
MLLPDLANKIVSEVRKLLDEDIIVVDNSGMIMASTDPSRIGHFHEGAYIVSQQKEKLVITSKDEKTLEGVKAGINLPIFFNQDVVGVIGITGAPEKVSPYGELLKKMTELLIQESYLSERVEWQYRAIETFVFDWIQQREWNKTFLDRSSLLGIDLTIGRQAALAHIEDNRNLDRHIWQTILSWNEDFMDDLIVRWGNDRILFLMGTKKSESKRRLRARLDSFKKMMSSKFNMTFSIGIGQKVPPHLLKKSYDQAERALKVARRNKGISFDDELTLEMLFDDIRTETKKEFIDRTITELMKDKELIQTIRALFQHNLSLKKTADRLHIHINTLHYRLKKIEEISGLNPRGINDLLTLYLALIFLDEHTNK